MTRLLAISGSLRRASSNTAVLEAAAALAPPGVEVELYRHLGDLPLFDPDEPGCPPAVARLRDPVLDEAGGVGEGIVRRDRGDDDHLHVRRVQPGVRQGAEEPAA